VTRGRKGTEFQIRGLLIFKRVLNYLFLFATRLGLKFFGQGVIAWHHVNHDWNEDKNYLDVDQHGLNP